MDNEPTEGRLDVAVQRIEAEKVARTGRLDLANLGLRRLLPALWELDWLEELRLGGVIAPRYAADHMTREVSFQENRLGESVPSLARLSRLRRLTCTWTDLRDLTPVADLTPLARLTALQSLDLWETSLNGLPEAILRLPRLQRLVINPQRGLGDIPSEVLSQGSLNNCLPRLRAHLADLAVGAEPLRDVKVIVLGNGRVGKTQLCRRLRGESFEDDADSTHGINVTSQALALPTEHEPAVLNLWDFGGQDLYHGTHALFMRTRAVFLVVWTPQSEQGAHRHGGQVFHNQPLPY